MWGEGAVGERGADPALNATRYDWIVEPYGGPRRRLSAVDEVTQVGGGLTSRVRG